MSAHYTGGKTSVLLIALDDTFYTVFNSKVLFFAARSKRKVDAQKAHDFFFQNMDFKINVGYNPY